MKWIIIMMFKEMPSVFLHTLQSEDKLTFFFAQVNFQYSSKRTNYQSPKADHL